MSVTENETEARQIGLTITRQIGRPNILAISGGRVYVNEDGDVLLPVSNGYRVTIRLDRGSDTYTVRRIFHRGNKTWIKGERSDVYCDEVGEVAYQASCFRNGAWGTAVES